MALLDPLQLMEPLQLAMQDNKHVYCEQLVVHWVLIFYHSLYCRRKGSLKAPLKVAKVKVDTRQLSNADLKAKDEEEGQDSSDSDVPLVDKSLPSLFSPAPRARSLMDVRFLWFQQLAPCHCLWGPWADMNLHVKAWLEKVLGRLRVWWHGSFVLPNKETVCTLIMLQGSTHTNCTSSIQLSWLWLVLLLEFATQLWTCQLKLVPLHFLDIRMYQFSKTLLKSLYQRELSK